MLTRSQAKPSQGQGTLPLEAGGEQSRLAALALRLQQVLQAATKTAASRLAVETAVVVVVVIVTVVVRR